MLRRTVLRLPLVVVLLGAAPLVAPSPMRAEPGLQQHTTGEVRLAAGTDGNLTHTVRHADRHWDRFTTLRTVNAPSHLVSTTVDGEEHLLHDDWSGRLSAPFVRHRIHRADGTWDSSNPGFGGSTADLAVAAVAGELHVVRRSTAKDATVEHRVRHADGTWSILPAAPVSPGPDGSVAVAGLGRELHLLITNQVGNSLLSFVRYPDGVWSPATTVPFTVRTIQASTVDIAVVRGELHAVVLGSDGNLYHSIRHRDGAWDRFDDVAPETGDPGTPDHVSVTASRGALHLAISTREGGLFHTIRHPDRTWQPFGDVRGETGQVSTTEVAISGD